MKKPQEPLPDTEDQEAWKKLTQEVTKIKKPEKITSSNRPRELIIRETLNVTPPSSSVDKDLFDNTSDIDGSTMRRFQKNEMKVEAELDLHGYTEDKAYDAVFKFIQKSYQLGRRCVIIITGKGYHTHSDDDILENRAVLKNAVPNWLNSDSLKPFILSVTHPAPKLGGPGALYILLRKNKK